MRHDQRSQNTRLNNRILARALQRAAAVSEIERHAVRHLLPVLVRDEGRVEIGQEVAFGGYAGGAFEFRRGENKCAFIDAHVSPFPQQSIWELDIDVAHIHRRRRNRRYLHSSSRLRMLRYRLLPFPRRARAQRRRDATARRRREVRHPFQHPALPRPFLLLFSPTVRDHAAQRNLAGRAREIGIAASAAAVRCAVDRISSGGRAQERFPLVVVWGTGGQIRGGGSVPLDLGLFGRQPWLIGVRVEVLDFQGRVMEIRGSGYRRVMRDWGCSVSIIPDNFRGHGYRIGS